MAKACLVSGIIIVMWILERHPFNVSTMDIKTTSCPGPHPIQGVVVFHLKPSVVVVVKRPETVRASQAWLAPPPHTTAGAGRPRMASVFFAELKEFCSFGV